MATIFRKLKDGTIKSWITLGNFRNAKIEKKCEYCGKLIKVYPCQIKIKKGRFCSQSCWAKFRPSPATGKTWKMPEGFGKRVKLWMSGEKNPKWIKDRTKLKDDYKDRGGQLHREWSNQVKKRDNWKCKINNEDCIGKVTAHHILGWKLYPKLRYEVNNGITLCLAHHPKKRAEEKRLIPFFNGLVSVSN